PYRIDPGIAGDHGDLGTTAWVARSGLDLDDAVVDFRHFLREELHEKFRPRPRQKNLRPARFFADVEDHCPDTIVAPIVLARQHLVLAEHGFGAAQIDDYVAELVPLHQAVYDFPNPVLILAELTKPLGIAHLLHDDLLRRLRRNSAKVDRRQCIYQEFPDLSVRLETPRSRERQLGRLVFHGIRVVHDLAVAGQLDLARPTIDLRTNIVLMAVFRATGLLNGLLHRLQDLVPVDPLLAGDRVGNLNQLWSEHLQHGGQPCPFSAAARSSFVSTSFARRISWNGTVTSSPSTAI